MCLWTMKNWLNSVAARAWYYAEVVRAACWPPLRNVRTVSATEASLLLDPDYGMLYLQNSDTTSVLDSLGANWSHICLSRTLNHDALWHIVFLHLRNILTYLLTYLQCVSTIWATGPVPVVDNAYLYPYGPYPTRAEDFYPRLHWEGWLPQSHI